MLIDHDARSNYGSWSACAGLGPGKARFFNTVLQSKKFDPDGSYIRNWVEELKYVPDEYIHDVWNHTQTLAKIL
jgi:deoxyribodipyrimidine photo-lyase